MTHTAPSSPVPSPGTAPSVSSAPAGAVLYVGLGGALGTLLRVLCIGVQPEPLGLFWVNTLGSAVLGVISAVLLWVSRSHALAGERWRLFLSVGVCGGFTSYSAIAVAVLALQQQSTALVAVVYAVVTLCAGAAAAALTEWVTGRSLARLRPDRSLRGGGVI